MKGLKSSVVIVFDMVGYHHYPNAPKEVEFLKHQHRHLFQFKVHYHVSDLNREKEIFIQERELKKQLRVNFGTANSGEVDFGAQSCEMIAEWIYLKNEDDGVFKVEVYEDAMGGAIVEI